jgi:hypothetical protein
MIPSKYKSAHYLINRFKPLSKVIEWFERESVIYSDDDIAELWNYFKQKCSKDLLLLSICSDDVDDREMKIVNTANILRYCHNQIQSTIIERLTENIQTTS